jgi:hypothetical protein
MAAMMSSATQYALLMMKISRSAPTIGGCCDIDFPKPVIINASFD